MEEDGRITQEQRKVFILVSPYQEERGKDGLEGEKREKE
jgi:hypothetical protein